MADKNFDIVEALTKFSAERGHSILDLAMSWLASKPCISSVIAGATSAEQVVQNSTAASWRLTVEEMAQVAAISQR